MSWNLFNHNFNVVPYACDAFSEYVLEHFTYVWLLNDKESSYNGVMKEEISDSQILEALGSVTHVGESAPLLDSCEGITGWRIRPPGYQANTANFIIDHPEAHDLARDGFGYAFGLSKPAASSYLVPLLQVTYQYFTSSNHTVNIVIAIDNATTIHINVLATSVAGGTYNESYTLPTDIADDDPKLWYIEYDRNGARVYFDNVLVIDHGYRHNITMVPFQLPAPGDQFTSAEIGMLNNSSWDHQVMALGDQLSDSERDGLSTSFDRNFIGFTP